MGRLNIASIEKSLHRYVSYRWIAVLAMLWNKGGQICVLQNQVNLLGMQALAVKVLEGRLVVAGLSHGVGKTE